MSTNKKQSFATQAILDMEGVRAEIVKESKDIIKSLLSEEVKDALRGSIEGDEFEVSDDDENAEQGTETGTTEEPANDEGSSEVQDEPESQEGNEGEEGETDDSDDMSQFDQYKVGNDTYDLTGEEDYDKVVKVYKRLKDTDKVVIKKTGDTLKLDDKETGTEYVIDLGEEDDADDEASVKVLSDSEGEEVTGNNDEELNEGNEYELELDDDQSDSPAGLPKMNENKRKSNKKTMKESKNEVLFEVDLGYTDNYQDKDPIKGLSNNEPSKSGKSWHKGVPTGTEKPWAGKTDGKGKPFEKKVNEDVEECCSEEQIEEGAKTVSSQSAQKETHTPTSEPRAKHARMGAKLMHAEGEYAKLQAENKRYKAENKALKEAVMGLQKDMNEALITQVNLGKVTKLFLENTTSQAEKINIINRFSEGAKTKEQSKALYETISKELQRRPIAENLIEGATCKTVQGSNVINEQRVYKTNDLMKTIDLMNRVNLC